jgi:Domain of unknown function (DUF4349)
MGSSGGTLERSVSHASGRAGSGPRLTASPSSAAGAVRAPGVPGGPAVTAIDALTKASPRGSPVSTAASRAAASVVSAAQPALQPPDNGRKIVQSAQLALATAPSRVETVAQEVFDAVGQDGGIVNRSSVTANGGPGGYAQFQLSIPSSSLPQAMASLSTLRYARVSSRTDTTQDVTDQYQSDQRKLGDARALRTSLLKQLANAVTQEQIDSFTAQLHDAEASISSDFATLRTLGRQIDYTPVTLTINGGVIPVASHSSNGSGLTLHTAVHDAGRVLTVAAGVALIALAVLVPIALLGALGWWLGTAVRRRRREQALDLV